MPVNLNESETFTIPETVVPAIQATKAWIETVIIRVPFDGTWSAIVESHPTDGTKVYRRDSSGNDTVLRIESQNLQADMAKDPSLVEEVNKAMTAIISVTSKIKALRDAEAEEAKKS